MIIMNLFPFFLLFSVLWHCWLGGRKGIRPVKNFEWWGAGMVICLERGAGLHMAQLMPLPLTVSCFSKIRLVLPFWYQLTWVVLYKGPLNGSVCVFFPAVFSVYCCLEGIGACYCANKIYLILYIALLFAGQERPGNAAWSYGNWTYCLSELCSC